MANNPWAAPASLGDAAPELASDTIAADGGSRGGFAGAERSGAGPARILFLDHTAKLGGGEIALLHLAANLDRARFTPIVLLGAEGDLRDRLCEAGVETHVLPLDDDILSTRKDSLSARSVLKLGTLVRLARYSGSLAQFIRSHQIDVVHTNSLKSDVLGAVAGRRARVPVVWHVRDRIANDYLPAVVASVFRSLCQCVPQFVIANSAATLRTVFPETHGDKPGAAGRRCAVVHDAVGPSYAARAARPVELPERTGAPRIGLVGRITSWKGQHVFIRAAHRVLKEAPEAEFLIVGSAMFGEDAYEAELHTLVNQLGVRASVKFLGFRSDVEQIIASLDLLVHASTVPEPFGQVVIEGMASGTPVIATRGGGVVEIVEDGVTGVLVAMGSDEEMAAAILALLGDRPRSRAIADAARRAVLERFTIQAPVRTVQGIYDQMLRSRASGRLL